MNQISKTGDQSSKKNFQPLKLVLASNSPRRQSLLKLCGYEFTIQPANINEVIKHQAPFPIEVAIREIENLAAQKAFCALKLLEKNLPSEKVLCIGCDTVLFFHNDIIGKPTSAENAEEMLKMLSGKTHQVITAVAIINNHGIEKFVSISDVTFFDVEDDFISSYVASGKPLDKAGSYGIQDEGALMIKKIKGDFYGIMGLPIAELNQRLKKYPII